MDYYDRYSSRKGGKGKVKVRGRQQGMKNTDRKKINQTERF